MKIGRNEICPKCDSGKKYKKCCGDPRIKSNDRTTILDGVDFDSIISGLKTKELIRKQQQGLGKPIIQTKFEGQQIVAVGSTLYHSPNWNTFPDFLSDYIKMVMGSDWGNNEIKKGPRDRHIIIQWYQNYCVHQKKYLTQQGIVQSMPTNGLCHCYIGLAYNLYLLKHNVELQQRFIERLKDINNFQGAYYELIVANCLIRAGFDLELEDEQDESSKHCEFSAVSKKTGKKYWVEAKARSVAGVLGKTEKNGTKRKNPTARISSHLKNALLKPASNERLIFIDLNAPCDDDKMPDWFDRAEKILKMKDADLADGISAYVFITNFSFHYRLNKEKQPITALTYGLGIPDYAKNEPLRCSEIYRRKQKHIDCFNIMDSFKSYFEIPQTFDGSLPSENLNGPSQRIIIGEKYFFEEEGYVATVTDATVDETSKKIFIGTDEGYILTKQMSDSEFEDFKRHPDVYFGIVRRQGKKSENEYEFFEYMVDIHMSYSRESTLNKLENSHDYKQLKKLNKEDLVVEYCERLVGTIINRRKDN